MALDRSAGETATATGVPTHSSRPSAKIWCFQIGMVALRRSIRAREASYAWPRWAADAATTTATSPMSQLAGAVHGREGDHLELGGDPLGHLAHPVQAVGWAV